MCCLSSWSVFLAFCLAADLFAQLVRKRLSCAGCLLRTESTQSCECKPVFLGTASLDDFWFILYVARVSQTRSQRQASAVRACVRAFHQSWTLVPELVLYYRCCLFAGGGEVTVEVTVGMCKIPGTFLLSWSVFLVPFLCWVCKVSSFCVYLVLNHCAASLSHTYQLVWRTVQDSTGQDRTATLTPAAVVPCQCPHHTTSD